MTKRLWLLTTYNQEEQALIRQQYYQHMQNIQQDIYFFQWFEQNNHTLNVITKTLPWLTTNSQKIYEYYPPTTTISIDHQSKQYFATPYKTNALNNNAKNFDNIIQQNNYTNTYLQQVGKHLQTIEHYLQPKPPESEQEVPMFIPPTIIPRLTSPYEKTLDTINEMLSKLSLTDKTQNISLEKNKNKVSSSSLAVLNQIDINTSTEEEEEEEEEELIFPVKIHGLKNQELN